MRAMSERLAKSKRTIAQVEMLIRHHGTSAESRMSGLRGKMIASIVVFSICGTTPLGSPFLTRPRPLSHFPPS